VSEEAIQPFPPREEKVVRAGTRTDIGASGQKDVETEKGEKGVHLLLGANKPLRIELVISRSQGKR